MGEYRYTKRWGRKAGRKRESSAAKNTTTFPSLNVLYQRRPRKEGKIRESDERGGEDGTTNPRGGNRFPSSGSHLLPLAD